MNPSFLLCYKNLMKKEYKINFTKKAVAISILLVALLAAYSNSFHSGFQLDDIHQVVKNPSIRNISANFFYDPHTATYQTGFEGYRPITMASFAFSYLTSGLDTDGFHLFNFAVHLLNTILIYIIFVLIFRESGEEGHGLRALFPAAAFALHPIQTGTVTYISGRAVLLASFFSLAAIYFFIKARSSGRVIIFSILSGAMFLLGLLSKEMAVCTPFIALSYDTIFQKFKNKNSLQRIFPYLPLLIVLFSYLAARHFILGNMVPGTSVGARDYLFSEGRAFLLYLRLSFFPFDQNADYNFPIIHYLNSYFLISAIILILFIYIIITLRKNNPAAAFFCAWFLVALAPESSLVPILDIAQEYRLYLASAGLFGAIAAAILNVRSPIIRWSAVPFFIILLLLGVLTFNRNFVWADQYSFWSDVVHKTPDSPRAHAGLGFALMQAGNYDAALSEFRMTLRKYPLYPDRGSIHNNIGFCLVQKADLPGAIKEFKEAIRLEPNNVEGYANLGDAFLRAGMYSEALETLLKGKTVNSRFAFGLCRLSDAYAALGLFKDELSEITEAGKYFSDDFMVRYDLAVAYYNNGMHNQAIKEAQTALSLAQDPTQKEGAATLLKNLASIRIQ